jgi:hypothetical protein
MIAADHFQQVASNGHDNSLTTGMDAMALNNGHVVTIEVDLDRHYDGLHQPFWKGYVLEHEDPFGSVAVGFARALDDSKSSRSSVIAQLMGVVRRREYLLDIAVDMSTGELIEVMQCRSFTNL